MRPLDVDGWADAVERRWHEASGGERGDLCPACEREVCADPADCEAARACSGCGDALDGPVGSRACWSCLHERGAR